MLNKIIWTQFWVLFLGTIFAWGNFINELIKWLNRENCNTGCVFGLKNPFLTPCFYGALFFLVAFILSCLIIKASKKTA